MLHQDEDRQVGSPGGPPERTTPTWEMELLLSGALVFGLAQLPREVDALFYPAFNRLSGGGELLALLAWLYAKASLLTLLGTFVLHLAARGYWVALVGLDSVYPGGIRWERLQMGPYLREASGSDDPGGMAARIERADDRASRIFGMGVGLALATLVPLLLVVFGALLDALLASLPSPPRRPWGLTVAATLLVGYGLLYLVDRWLGPRIPAGSAAGRVLRGAFRRLRWLGLGNPGSALIAIFQGAEGTGRTTLLTTAVLLPVTALVALQLLAETGRLDLGRFPGLPDDRPGAQELLLPGHYGNQRGDGRTANPLPFIPERVVRGPYLELFVPYVPRRDAVAVDARCPEPRGGRLDPAGAAAGEVRDRLDCVGALFPVRLDGQPLAVRFDAATDPMTGNRGLLAMTGLAPGRHELEIDRPRPPEDDSRARARPPWRIPFWR